MAKPKWTGDGAILNPETWTTDDVQGAILDVRTVGVGGFPAVIQDDQWIAANAIMISSMGSETYLTALLAKLREAFG